MPIYKALTSIDLRTIVSLEAEVVVLGSGLAGLAAAIAASRNTEVLLLAKSDFSDTATYKAQGGVAVALDELSPDSHGQDTLEVGAGLCNPETVKLMVEEGVERVRELIKMGLPFDRDGDKLAYTLEGGHSYKRVLHAQGDATGRAIHTYLNETVKNHPKIRILENHFAIDLLHQKNICSGVLCLDTHFGRMLRIDAQKVIVATGGLGQIYRETTNPEVATGDGYAMCFRAGAKLMDMEFVQFHPTTLYLAGAPRFLISEAVRGEGAHLLNLKGKRFMPDFHKRAELAPRDVVSRSIFKTMRETQTSHVLLDLRHLSDKLINKRFPNICKICADYGLNIKDTPIPVRPAAHYMMGGVESDKDGLSSVENLYVCGEVACTGVHGANRLASNSLLEAIVFGHRAGVHATRAKHLTKSRYSPDSPRRESSSSMASLDIADIVQSLRALAWRNLGVYRCQEQLQEAEDNIIFWERYVLREEFTARAGFEIQNMLTVAKLITRAASSRKESRGAHLRSDFPERDDKNWQHHIIFSRDDFNK